MNVKPQDLGKKAGGSRRRTSLFAHGEPMVWITGGALAVALFMVLGLLLLIAVKGFATFWPGPLVHTETMDGCLTLGEITREESYHPTPEVLDQLPAGMRTEVDAELRENEGQVTRELVRTGNFDLTGVHFQWIRGFEIRRRTEPEWALVVERQSWGRFYGAPVAFLLDGERTATEPEEVWAEFEKHHDAVRDLWEKRRDIENDEIGALSYALEEARLGVRRAEIDHGAGSHEHVKAQASEERLRREQRAELHRLAARVDDLNRESDRYQLLLRTADGTEQSIPLAEIVRAYPANRIGLGGKLSVYISRWWEFLTEDPREANSEGGVWPAIFGTVVMTLLMCLLVVPFGILAALYLREYAKAGPVVSTVRIAINNLAGVPSIVFGVFGLGFFCYVVGAGMDELFYAARLPNPTYGKGGLMWAAFTLALLTLPVVIVSTEEALAAVPGSMREGSYACGASKWQTIRRIVLPRAMPGIMTGIILAMARGAGEVAPLMLVGAVKLAPDLPIDFVNTGGSLGPLPLGPIHPERSFMHLGFHIYDLGFQSQNSEAAKPMVYTTVLLLISIVVLLNITAIWMRGRLRKRFGTGHF